MRSALRLASPTIVAGALLLVYVNVPMRRDFHVALLPLAVVIIIVGWLRFGDYAGKVLRDRIKARARRRKG